LIAVEAEFDILIPAPDITPANFRSISIDRAPDREIAASTGRA